jgi:hypothetical protein
LKHYIEKRKRNETPLFLDNLLVVFATQKQQQTKIFCKLNVTLFPSSTLVLMALHQMHATHRMSACSFPINKKATFN